MKKEREKTENQPLTLSSCLVEERTASIFVLSSSSALRWVGCGDAAASVCPLAPSLSVLLLYGRSQLVAVCPEWVGETSFLCSSGLHNIHHYQQQQHLHSPTLQPGATAGAAGAIFDSKQGAASSSYSASSPLLLPPPLPPPQPSSLRPPTAPLQPSDARPLMAPGLRPGGPLSALHSHSVELAMDEEEALKGPEPCSPPPEVSRNIHVHPGWKLALKTLI